MAREIEQRTVIASSVEEFERQVGELLSLGWLVYASTFRVDEWRCSCLMWRQLPGEPRRDARDDKPRRLSALMERDE